VDKGAGGTTLSSFGVLGKQWPFSPRPFALCPEREGTGLLGLPIFAILDRVGRLA